MPRKIEKTVYTFQELIELGNTSAIEKARQWLSDGQTDHDWWDYTYQMWKEALAQIGFENADISFSGFWCQGDGASFTARVNLKKLIAFLAAPPEASEVIGDDPEDFRPWLVHKCNGVRSNPKFVKLLGVLNRIDDVRVERDSSNYVHENTCSFHAALQDRGRYTDTTTWTWTSRTPRVRALFNEFSETVEELRLDLSRAIYKALEEEHEYLTGNESLLDFAEANDYTFDEYGNRE